ncbi:MAG: peptidoglycan editing factor PgeF [Balneolales bacterium]
MNTLPVWSSKKVVRAAFVARGNELSGQMVRKVTGLPTASDEIQALEANRILVSELLDLPYIELSMGKQVHGSHIAYTEKSQIVHNTDGLVTDKTGLAIAVLVADCAAVLLADRVNKIIAAIHAGWRGAVAGIVPKAVHKMIMLGAEQDLIEAYISPCISKDRFEVGEEVASRFPSRFVDRSKPKPHVDLPLFVRSELKKTGIYTSNVVMDNRCTFENSDLLHSYRRDGEQSGRMMAVVTLV